MEEHICQKRETVRRGVMQFANVICRQLFAHQAPEAKELLFLVGKIYSSTFSSLLWMCASFLNSFLSIVACFFDRLNIVLLHSYSFFLHYVRTVIILQFNKYICMYVFMYVCRMI